MTKYDEALEEYTDNDDNGRHRLIYAYFGLAIYQSQCLEETFSIMLWTDRIFKKKVKTNSEVNEIIDSIENSKKTMGGFINELKSSYQLSDDHKTQLGNLLEKRNYLAHKYFKIEIFKFHSETGQKEMLKYFADFIDETLLLDNELKKYYTTYTHRLGLTEERIESVMKVMKEQELERVKNIK